MPWYYATITKIFFIFRKVTFSILDICLTTMLFSTPIQNLLSHVPSILCMIQFFFAPEGGSAADRPVKGLTGRVWVGLHYAGGMQRSASSQD